MLFGCVRRHATGSTASPVPSFVNATIIPLWFRGCAIALAVFVSIWTLAIGRGGISRKVRVGFFGVGDQCPQMSSDVLI
jgi:hypothetical protein